MDEDEFHARLEALYKQRKENGCPTTDCPHLQETILAEVASNSFELCVGINALMAVHQVELDVKTISDLIILVSGSMAKCSSKTINLSFELCQACSVSKLIGDKNIQ